MRPFPRKDRGESDSWDSIISVACERFSWTIDQVVSLTPSQLLKVLTENGRKNNSDAADRLPTKKAGPDLIKELNTLQKKAGKPVSNKR